MRTPGHGQEVLQILIRTFQHAFGLSKPLLKQPNQCTQHLKGYYYVYLRKFLAEHKIQMEFVCVNSPELEYENDQFVMDQVCATTIAELDDQSIRTINSCRSYLQVQQISDICTIDGNYILDSIF